MKETTKMNKLTLIYCLLLLAARSMNAQEIFNAVNANDLAKVKTLIEKDTSLIRVRDPGGNTPLHRAAITGSVQIVGYILSKGGDINAKDNRGYTPLHYSCQYDFENVAKLLIEKGAGVNIQDNRGLSPIFLAARSGNLNLTKILVDKGADPNARIQGVWVTPLSWSAENGFADVVNYLLDNGAEADTGNTQLKRFAVSKGLVKLFKTLQEKKASFDLWNNNGGGLLHFAAEGGAVEIIESFIRNGTDIDMKDRYGWTPLHYAVYNDNKEAVSFFIGKGSKIDERNLSGKTAYNIALERGNFDIMKILRDARADTAPQSFPELKGHFLGQKEPGRVPELFALGIVSTAGIEHGNITISPNGSEIFWTSSYKASLRERSVGSFKVFSSRIEKGKWSLPRMAFFTKNEITTDDVPYFSPDETKMIFMSRRASSAGGKDEADENYWYVEKRGNTWSSPAVLDDVLNSFQIRWQIAIADNGTLYFGASRPDGKGGSDIYMSRFVNGKYSTPENLGVDINSQAEESTPYVAPDENYIIFNRESRTDRNFKNGLYVSFKNKEGNWSKPVYLGDEINRGGGGSPYVSPDGKCLFFNSGRNGNYDIYWVSAKFIEELRPKE